MRGGRAPVSRSGFARFARGATARRSAIAAALWLSTGRPLGADEPPTAPAAPGEARTTLESGVLARSDAVVVGSARVLRRGVGAAPTLVRVAVEKVLRGKTESEETLFLSGDLLNAGSGKGGSGKAPAEPLAEGEARRYALFLARSPAGSGFRLVSLFGVEDSEGREKLAVLEQEIPLAAISDPAERARRTVEHLLALLAEDPITGTVATWSRWHAARELTVLARTAPGAVGGPAPRAIERVAAKASDPRLRDALGAILDHADPGRAGRATPLGAEAPAGGIAAEIEALRRRAREAPTARERVDALTALFQAGKRAAADDLLAATADPEPEVRERAAVLVGDAGDPASIPAVAKAFAAEPDPVVRDALVRAIGLLGDDAVVPWLADRATEAAADAARLRPVLFALARVRSPAALEALERVRTQAGSVPGADRVTERLVDYLRSPAFEEAERVAGRVVGPRKPSGAQALPGAQPGATECDERNGLR